MTDACVGFRVETVSNEELWTDEGRLMTHTESSVDKYSTKDLKCILRTLRTVGESDGPARVISDVD